MEKSLQYNLESMFSNVSVLQKRVDSMQSRVDEEASKLIPQVLDHFNQFVKENLAPKFKDGWTVDDATVARYEGARGFEIEMGRSHNGSFSYYDRFWPGEEVIDLLKKYEKGTPWVARVRSSFYFPK